MKSTIFMVMPFADPVAASAYQYSTKPVAQAHGFAIQRADEIFGTNPIFDDIVTAIEQSALVIVDISGRNANCFYELGVSHTLKQKRTIMVTHDPFEEVPFDVAHFRILRYEDSIEGKAKYEAALAKTLVSVTTGLAELFHPEFAIICDLLLSTESEATIFASMGLAKASSPVKTGSVLNVEGHLPGKRGSSAGGLADLYFAPLLARGLVEVVDQTYSLTSKGQAFNDYLSQKGFAVDWFNGETLTPGHESFFERALRQAAERKAAKGGAPG